MEKIIIKKLIENPKYKNFILGTSFFMSFVGSLLMITSSLIVAYYINSEQSLLFYILLICIGYIFYSFKIIISYFQSSYNSKYYVIVTSLVLFLSFIIKVVAIHYEVDFIFFIYIFMLEQIIYGISLLCVYIYKNTDILNWKVSKRLSKNIFLESWPIMLSSFSIILYMKIDQVMLKYMINSDAVGYYSASLKIAELWYMIPTIILSGIFPYFVKVAKENYDLFMIKLQVFYNIFIIISVVITIFLIIYSQTIILLLYGYKYQPSSELLICMSIIIPVVYFSILKGPWTLINNRQMYNTYYTIIGLSINIILNYYLIQKYGVYGAIFATIVAQIFVNLVLPFLIKEDRITVLMFFRAFNILNFKLRG